MKKTIAIIGGGASALMLAAQLNENKFDVSIYEKNGTLGRKFLVAGDGGFNLTHSEEAEQLILKYVPSYFFAKTIKSFSNVDLRKWLSSIGIETFVGSSKRVFPVKGIKPIDVLNVILDVLKKKRIKVNTRHVWKGWDNGQLLFDVINSATDKDIKSIQVKADIVVFALGGASWKITGSDGTWTNYFSEKGIVFVPFQASNCAFEIKWSKTLLEKAEGKSVKNILLMCGDKQKKGELVITKFGLEGGAIYALSNAIRTQLNQTNEAELFLDLKPNFSVGDLENSIGNRGNKSISQLLENELNLDTAQMALIRSFISKEEFVNAKLLAEKIKNLPLIVTSVGPMDKAISTAGGISLNETDETFQLKKLPNHYVIGEMLDWDAPTGGYLLQGCFSMGYCLAKNLNESN
jgi:uncharacterized flavoprotein (TIGR03862 family)